MARLHAVDPAAALGGNERRAEHDVRDAVAEPGDDTGHDEAARRVRDDDDRVGDARGLDVGEHRRDLVVDAQRREVGGLAVAARQIDRERGPVEERHAAGPRTARSTRRRG